MIVPALINCNAVRSFNSGLMPVVNRTNSCTIGIPTLSVVEERWN